jgi:peptidoglycan/LPS O-acetylase OafA/YrhL
MAQLHAIGATITLGAILVTAAAAAVLALRGGSPWTNRLRYALTVIIGLQLAEGALLYLSRARPREELHLLYGLAALAILPLAGSFASEAPPRPRAWVLSATCLVLILLAWRLASTG